MKKLEKAFGRFAWKELEFELCSFKYAKLEAFLKRFIFKNAR